MTSRSLICTNRTSLIFPLLLPNKILACIGQVNEGLEKVAKGEARYRVVLTIEDEAAM